MSILLKNHLGAFAILFTLALVLYLTGLHWEAERVFLLGCIFELAAWIAILSDRNPTS